MTPTRREFLGASAAALACAAAAPVPATRPAPAAIDPHVHVWDLDRFNLPWVRNAGPKLNRSFSVADYREASAGRVGRAVYVEVAVEPGQRLAEAEAALVLCRQRDALFAGAVLAADPAADDFAAFLDRFRGEAHFKGIRGPLRAGGSRDGRYVAGLKLLAARSLAYDLYAGSTIGEGAGLARAVPDCSFIVNHCGGASARLFAKDADAGTRDARDRWRRTIDDLAARPNVVCKISGVAETGTPADGDRDAVAAVVDHCLDTFGRDRVMWASNYPVCLKGTTPAEWLTLVNELTARRGQAYQTALFATNAARVYRL